MCLPQDSSQHYFLKTNQIAMLLMRKFSFVLISICAREIFIKIWHIGIYLVTFYFIYLYSFVIEYGMVIISCYEVQVSMKESMKVRLGVGGFLLELL